MERIFATVFVLVLPGLLLIVYGFWLLKGGNKAAFMARHMYSGRVYMYIPGGITALFWALATVPESTAVSEIILWVGLGFGAIALVCAFIQPSMLKPSWLKWLEREHGDVLELLADEVQRVGGRAWNEQVKTQSELEEWVDDIRHSYQ